MQISMRDWEEERKADLPIVKHRIGVHFGVCLLEMLEVVIG